MNKSLTSKEEILTILKEIAILLAITVVAGGLLGLVYFITKEPIAEAKNKVEQNACAAVMKDADSFSLAAQGSDTKAESVFAGTDYEGIAIDKVFKAVNANGELTGYVVSVTTSKGYGGNINLFVGMDLTSNVTGISVIEINETPGLGMRAEAELTPQFVGRGSSINQFAYTKTGAAFDYQVDAISGATITTKAVTGEVNAVLYYSKNLLEKGGL